MSGRASSWVGWAALALSGCAFQVEGVKVVLDDASVAPIDSAVVIDLGRDLARSVFDAASPGDMETNVPVSHLGSQDYTDGACDLVVTRSIDTTAMMVDGAAVPMGCTFGSAMENGTLAVRVLSVRSFTVSAGVTVVVSGGFPLVVVAAGSIDIAGTLDGSAHTVTPGPGGAIGDMGPGSGGNGTHAGTYDDSGGGGAGFAVAGAAGGAGNKELPIAIAGAAGTMYQNPTLSLEAPGGSGGGFASSEGCTVLGRGGGAGGGSIQLSALTAMSVTGTVAVSGGGGVGGCRTDTNNVGSGGGGGSGGSIFVEAPMMMLSGSLWANGGGGGGGGSGDLGAIAGVNGQDGQPGTTAAPGGDAGGGTGGAGGTGGTDAAPTSGAANFNAGGGGGSAGRIVVRTRASATLAGSSSPTAVTIFDL